MFTEADDKTEIAHLNAFNSFYKTDDFMDYLLIDRCNELIAKHCRTTSGNSLEIGCGEGYSTGKLAGHFENLEVLEASPENIKLMIKNTGLNTVCHSGLLEDFLPTKKYNNVFLCMC